MHYPKKPDLNLYQSRHCAYITYRVKTCFLKILSVSYHFFFFLCVFLSNYLNRLSFCVYHFEVITVLSCSKGLQNLRLSHFLKYLPFKFIFRNLPRGSNNVRLLNSAVINDFTMLTYRQPLKPRDR